MRAAQILYKDNFAGTISESEDGYIFLYDETYLESADAKPVSLTLPLRKQPYTSKVLFPFFDGLIPEGWLLDIAIGNWKIDARDRFGLLLLLCRDCIGCVSVIAKEEVV